jgi:hypothetical protein
MKTISYNGARDQLAGLMEAASRDREPITIRVIFLSRLTCGQHVRSEQRSE